MYHWELRVTARCRSSSPQHTSHSRINQEIPLVLRGIICTEMKFGLGLGYSCHLAIYYLRSDYAPGNAKFILLVCKMLCTLASLQKGFKLEQFVTFELLFAFLVLLSSFLVPSFSASQLPSSFAFVVAVCYVFLSAPREKSTICVNIYYVNHN